MALVVLAGGGTAGHLAPGFAVADALRARGERAVFLTPGEAREAGWFPAGEPPPLHVPAPRAPRGALATAAFPFRMARAVAGARRLLRALRPDGVLALGGWPCAPAALAALTLRLPLFLLAVDAVPGSVVRRLQSRARRTYLARPEALAALPVPQRALVVGPVVRTAVAKGRRDPARFGLVPGRRTLLVVGGSLGAKGLNDRVREGLAAAVAADPGLASRCQVIHAAGTPDEAALAASTYDAAGIAHATRPFVVEIGDAFATADLVLCRGGASTLAEVAALGRPAVVVPYPHHADRQQWKNAEPLAARGQVVVLEEGALDPATFRTAVLGRLLDDEALAAMARAPAPPAAAEDSEDRGDPATTIARDLVRSLREAGAGPPEGSAHLPRPASPR